MGFEVSRQNQFLGRCSLRRDTIVAKRCTNTGSGSSCLVALLPLLILGMVRIAVSSSCGVSN
jgi:hypothetical protein